MKLSYFIVILRIHYNVRQFILHIYRYTLCRYCAHFNTPKQHGPQMQTLNDHMFLSCLYQGLYPVTDITYSKCGFELFHCKGRGKKLYWDCEGAEDRKWQYVTWKCKLIMCRKLVCLLFFAVLTVIFKEDSNFVLLVLLLVWQGKVPVSILASICFVWSCSLSSVIPSCKI